MRPDHPAQASAPGAALRVSAVRVIDQVIERGTSLKSILDQELPKWPDGRDRALLEAICFTVLRHHRRYRFAIDAWLQNPMPSQRLRPADRALLHVLMVGLAQLEVMGLAEHAAVSATVDAAKSLGLSSKAGLVNALLRRALREPLAASPNPAIQHSLPDWLHHRFLTDWPDEIECILEQGNRPGPLWLASVPASLPEFLEQLRQADIEAEVVEFPRGAVRLLGSGAITSIPGYAEGRWHVQDIAAQRCAVALEVRPGMRVLDACAAPGGKSLQILHALQGKGELWALDASPSRVKRLEQNLRRAAVDAAPLRLMATDAADISAWWDGQSFDRILLDAPCSATGVLRRQPDAKWNRRESDIPALVDLQARLLQALWPLLAKDGVMLYSTCSLLREENDRQIAAFLDARVDARLQALDERFGRVTTHGHQSFPGDGGGDGFFYAAIRKQADDA